MISLTVTDGSVNCDRFSTIEEFDGDTGETVSFLVIDSNSLASFFAAQNCDNAYTPYKNAIKAKRDVKIKYQVIVTTEIKHKHLQ